MQVQQHAIPTMAGEVHAFTLLNDGGWIAYTGDKRPPHGRGLRRTSNDQLVTASGSMKTPLECRNPVLATAQESHLVLADSHGGIAAVIDLHGNVAARFEAGDCIEQVLCNSERIVLTYFDQGVFSGRSPSDEGVAIFSPSGDFITGFHSKFGWKPVGIADCYCACLDPLGRLLFSPYTDFPLVRWDVTTGEMSLWELPEELHACGALSATESHAYFWAPQNEKTNRIFRFDLESGQITVAGELAPPRHRQPLPEGRFLAWDNTSYLIVDPTT
jgi:hypothetical protein